MTYDDGILKIYRPENTAAKGGKPVIVLKLKSQHYYEYDVLGYNRYYTALQARQQLEAVVNIPDWHNITATDICALHDGTQYRLATIQPMIDDDGLRMTKLSLERLGEAYVVSP